MQHLAEIIVYRYYIRLVHEGIIKSVRLGRQECNVIVKRLDGSSAYLYVFSIKPKLPVPAPGEKRQSGNPVRIYDDPGGFRVSFVLPGHFPAGFQSFSDQAGLSKMPSPSPDPFSC